jgi:hypothetical protein
MSGRFSSRLWAASMRVKGIAMPLGQFTHPQSMLRGDREDGNMTGFQLSRYESSRGFAKVQPGDLVLDHDFLNAGHAQQKVGRFADFFGAL